MRIRTTVSEREGREKEEERGRTEKVLDLALRVFQRKHAKEVIER
jgi:hypothetical protein